MGRNQLHCKETFFLPNECTKCGVLRVRTKLKNSLALQASYCLSLLVKSTQAYKAPFSITFTLPLQIFFPI